MARPGRSVGLGPVAGSGFGRTNLAGVEKPDETIHVPKVGPARRKPVKEHGPRPAITSPEAGSGAWH